MHRNSIETFMQPLESRDLRAADLIITGITCTPHITSVGQPFQITYTIKNQGSSSTTRTTFIRNYLSRDGRFGNSDDIGLDTEYYNKRIGAGKSVTLTVTSGTGIYQKAGSFRIGAKVDSLGFIDESNESNNTALSAANELTIAQYLENDSLVGTAGNDRIDLSIVSGRAIMVVNGKAYSKPIGFFGKSLFIDAGAGNDKIVASKDFNVALSINGGDGSDTIVGGVRGDSINGDAGDDRIFGSTGWDTIRGGAGNDSLFGQADRDYLFGDDGNDSLDAGTGTDKLVGGPGDDFLTALDGTLDYRDSLQGDEGFDVAVGDSDDVLTDIEA